MLKFYELTTEWEAFAVLNAAKGLSRLFLKCRSLKRLRMESFIIFVESPAKNDLFEFMGRITLELRRLFAVALKLRFQ